MALRIEDYALIGDTHTVALVGTNGSIDKASLTRALRAPLLADGMPCGPAARPRNAR